VIDENRNLCQSLSRLLSDEGHVVTCAQTGKEGLHAARQTKPDLIILDLLLPELPGIELFQRLSRHTETKKIPIIITSDHPELEDEIVQVFDFIPKPVDPERLLGDIRLLQEGKRRPEPTAGALGIRESESIREFLAEHSGLHFDRRNLKLLERGLLNRMQVLKIDSYKRYFSYLSQFGESRGELQKLLQCLTVGETYFFRYHSQFDAIRTFLLPGLFKRGKKIPIKIWSAGCSTGEEAYSLAMTIMDAVPDWRERDIKIIATDINNRSLHLAREGTYGPRALRATDRNHQHRYFEKKGDRYRVIDDVRSMVTFSHLNLQTSTYPSADNDLFDLDIILCRNVLIYFAAATARTIVQRMYTCLADGGHLFLGHAETLFHVTSKFERINHDGAFFYRRRDDAAPPERPAIRTINKTVRKLLPLPPREERSVTVLPLIKPKPQQRSFQELLQEAQTLFEIEDFRKAKTIVEELRNQEPQHPGVLILEGFILANDGLFEQALATCDQILAIDDLLPEAYHLRGLVHELAGDIEAAADNYQKAILLRMEFLMPHYHLGKLFLRVGRTKDGVRELRNTLRILERSQPEVVIPYSGGLSREVFLGLVRNDLAMVS
jgi:chemotaxis protein methyltransferase CheR